jgi:integrase
MNIETRTTAELTKLNESLVKAGDKHLIKKYNNFIDQVEKDNIIITESLPVEFMESIKHNYKLSSFRIMSYKLKNAIIKHYATMRLSENERQLLTYQIKEEFKKVKTGKSKEHIEDHEILTIEDIQIIEHKAGYKTGLIVKALYQTACRISELINIKLSDCQVVNKSQIAIKIIGKGKKERTVFINSNLFEEIKNAYQSEKYLFGKKPLSRFTVNNLLKLASKYINKHINPHMLRHTFASLNISKLGLSAISKYLGHSDTSTTARYYLHGKAGADQIANCW